MNLAFYVAGAVAIVSTVMMLTRLNAIHALLYLIVSLLSMSVIFYVLGSPFVAALEVIIYAGAIMVLFVFVMMMLNLGDAAIEQERRLLRPGIWVGPILLALILISQIIYLIATSGEASAANVVGPRQVGAALFGPVVIGVELVAMLLLGALVGAYHLGVGFISKVKPKEMSHAYDPGGTRADAGGDLVLPRADRRSGTT